MIPLNRNLLSLQRSPIRTFTNLANETPGCIKLTIGEPDGSTPDAIRDAAVAALHAGRTHYAPNQGNTDLRRAIAEAETARGNETTADQVLITVGASQALFTALLGILNPGEEVILPTPAFSLYDTIVTIAGGRSVYMDLTKTGFQITPELLRDHITPNTKAIVLNSPNNPTGTVLTEESLAAVKAAILGKPIFLICDNVYHDLSYCPCPDLTLDRELKEQTILCQSFSKPWAMTGWRIGYLTCPDYVMDRLLLLSVAQTAAVPTFVQDGALAALEVDTAGMRETYRRRRDYVTARLEAMGLQFPAPEGAFYVFPDISRFGLSSDEFCTRMIREAGVAAVPGSCFGAEGYIRLSYCYCDEELAEGLNRLESFIQQLLP
ncbi:MAG: aminotransferase class I/II-fold pyridoxal phosphate-dependent enzyme [Oscillospiraceae bacterium]|nr:aminotransferase class I/II-fold pyridoxal phosphate-dependent enzyme [Oscillospiraceae bacterium]